MFPEKHSQEFTADAKPQAAILGDAHLSLLPSGPHREWFLHPTPHAHLACSQTSFPSVPFAQIFSLKILASSGSGPPTLSLDSYESTLPRLPTTLTPPLPAASGILLKHGPELRDLQGLPSRRPRWYWFPRPSTPSSQPCFPGHPGHKGSACSPPVEDRGPPELCSCSAYLDRTPPPSCLTKW